MDGLDAVLVEAEGTGLDVRVRSVRYVSAELGELAHGLRAAAGNEPVTAHELPRLALELGELHAHTVGRLVDESGTTPSVCVLPGQTLVHAPPVSLQLINPWPVAHRLGCPVLHDIRGADIAAGGQGAPITPLADWVLFRSDTERRAIVNLGGFCNVTTIARDSDPDGIAGFDVCACTTVLDACARAALGEAYDRNGNSACEGTPDEDATTQLLDILRAQSSGGRSLGTGDECTAWVDRHTSLQAPTLLASATRAIGTAIGERVRDSDAVILAGGGTQNAALVRSIEDVVGACATTAAFGIGVQEREAVCIAVIGLLALDGITYTRQHITRRPRAISCEGSWIGVRP